jgi:hypothetical protein
MYGKCNVAGWEKTTAAPIPTPAPQTPTPVPRLIIVIQDPKSPDGRNINPCGIDPFLCGMTEAPSPGWHADHLPPDSLGPLTTPR